MSWGSGKWLRPLKTVAVSWVFLSDVAGRVRAPNTWELAKPKYRVLAHQNVTNQTEF